MDTRESALNFGKGGQGDGFLGLRHAAEVGSFHNVCVAFPAISAVEEGYKVFAVVDASGTYSKMAQEITLARLVQAGVVPIDTAAVASELQKSWHRDDAMQWADIYTKIFPPYRLLIESYGKAQEVVKKNERWLTENLPSCSELSATREARLGGS
jgi:nicotinamidase-related amidase